MSRITLSKTALNEARQALKRYRQCVPALEMKRQQLMQQHALIHRKKDQMVSQRLALEVWVEGHLPSQAWSVVDIEKLIKQGSVSITEQSILGVKMPVLSSITVERSLIEKLGSPVWIDVLQEKLIEGMKIALEIKVLNQQLDCVTKALKTASQRLNLFEKIRIPETQARIRKIEIALSDQERAAVVIAKISKQKQQKNHKSAQWSDR
jgi:V/A-type H+-transporting ATPase subunit D